MGERKMKIKIGNNLVCPRCGKTYSEEPAICRRDNKTKICPDCGLGEAMLDFALEGKSEEIRKREYLREMEAWDRPILPKF